MSRVNVVAFENGVGNSRDLALITAALEALGCEVTVTRISTGERRRRRSVVARALAVARRWAGVQPADGFDYTVMMEHVWPGQLHRAHCNIVMPNPEWFDRGDRRLLSFVDWAWTKTAHARDVFVGLGCRTTLTGFDSDDRHDPTVPRETAFLHLAGKSRMKGSGRLVALWARHPEWPQLSVVHSRKAAFRIVAAPNIDYHPEFLSDTELRRIQNAHAFHVCLSETEGWGHYIPEALSVGAVVIATNAAPMNELVTTERGLPVRAAAIGRQHLATTYGFDEADFEHQVGVALGLSLAERIALGASARTWFLANKADFPQRLGRALEAAQSS